MISAVQPSCHRCFSSRFLLISIRPAAVWLFKHRADFALPSEEKLPLSSFPAPPIPCERIRGAFGGGKKVRRVVQPSSTTSCVPPREDGHVFWGENHPTLERFRGGEGAGERGNGDPEPARCTVICHRGQQPQNDPNSGGFIPVIPLSHKIPAAPCAQPGEQLPSRRTPLEKPLRRLTSFALTTTKVAISQRPGLRTSTRTRSVNRHWELPPAPIPLDFSPFRKGSQVRSPDPSPPWQWDFPGETEPQSEPCSLKLPFFKTI